MNFNPFIELIVTVLGMFKFVIVLRVVLSWLIGFNILNTSNRLVDVVDRASYGLTEPVLRRVRNFLPNLGAIDISPIVVFLLINLIDSMLINYFYVMHL